MNKDTKRLLKMIEKVSPNDMEKLDEIDIRVWCWWHNHSADSTVYLNGKPVSFLEAARWVISNPRYTRSLDALSEMLPTGIYGMSQDDISRFSWGIDVWSSPYLPTECLAKLHAIIQAVEYGREQGETVVSKYEGILDSYITDSDIPLTD